jgi:hypothetical protein
MSLSDLASLGSFVSGLAVLASLVFLFFQMRQMTEQVRQSEKNQQAAIRQGRANQAVDININGADASVSEAINRGSRGEENISETALRQFHHYWRASFFAWQDAFNQHTEGLSTESAFDENESNVRNWLGNIGVRTQWRIQRNGFGREFVAWMDKLVAETPIDDSGDTVIEWRNGLAAERSGAPY